MTAIHRTAHGFYSKELGACGVVVRAHAVVPDEALVEAARRIERLVGRCPAVSRNLEAAGVELHVIGRGQVVSDLPMYRHLAGVPFSGTLTIDERGRGYGGLHACCDEDGLLRLPTARHADHRDVCSHELAHAVLSFGLDRELRGLVRARFGEARAEGLWETAYAATNVDEFFAELTMWYVGSRGDHGALSPPPPDGPDGLRGYDPTSYGLLDGIYSGRRRPGLFSWRTLASTEVDRSAEGVEPTDVVFENATDDVLELWWLDYRGSRVPYGQIPAGGLRSQATWASHVWVVTGPGGREVGRFVAGPEPGMAKVATPSPSGRGLG